MIWRRLLYFVQRRRLEKELAEEMAEHRAMMGAPADFGNAMRLREEAGDVWGWRWLDEIVQDLRHGVRVFRRTPSFALTAIAVLTLGLGVNLGLFQILNAALMRASNLRDPETLVKLGQMARDRSSSGVTYPLTQFIQEHNDVLASVLVVQHLGASWGDDLSQQVPAAFVSSNFFDELGAGAVQGRLLHDGDREPAVVLSYEFWQTRLGSDPRIVGSTVRFNGRPAVVAGVLTAGFYGPRGSRTQVWAPFEHLEYFYPGSQLKTEWGPMSVEMYARLRPGVTLTSAQEALRTPMAEAARQHPAAFGKDPWLALSSGARKFRRDREDREATTVIGLVTGLCLLVLAVACANLASLMVAHVNSRIKEFQMRAALGAGRARVLRQIVTECALLVTVGLICGWFAGYSAANWIARQTEAPFDVSPVPDLRLMAAAFGFGAVALLGVGLLPAWRAISSRRLAGGGISKSRMQRILIGVQVLGSCVLLLVAGMAVRKLQSVASANVGFEMDNIAVMRVELGRYGLAPEGAGAYWRALRDAAAADPRVRGVALSTYAPMGSSSAQSDFRDTPGLRVTTMTVDPNFHALMQIPILAGRPLQPGDTRESAIVISRRLAERMYGGTDVVGQSFPKSGDGKRATIVGIAADARLIRITASNMAESYSPMEPSDLPAAILLARVESGQIDALRAVAQRVNPAITPAVRWMKDDFEKKLMEPRMMSAGAAFMGGLALTLICIGIFGLVAYTVLLRTKEIGIRLALGAGRESVLWLVLGGLAVPVAVGGLLGAALVLVGLAKPLAGAPLFMDSSDPYAIAASLAALGVAGLLASYLPAIRALRIDAAAALREE